MVPVETIECLKALQWGRQDKKRKLGGGSTKGGLAMGTIWLLCCFGLNGKKKPLESILPTSPNPMPHSSMFARRFCGLIG